MSQAVRRIPTTLRASALAILVLFAVVARGADSPWPMFGGNAQHVGRSVGSVGASAVVQWRFHTKHQVDATAAIAGDGTVYITSWDHCLYALAPDGTLKWTFETEKMVSASPALGADGTIYVASYDYHLYAVGPDGKEKWAYATGGPLVGGPTVGPDGTVYVGSRDGKVYAVKPDGTLKWSFLTQSWVDGSPAVGADGTVYAGGYDGNLYALNADGTQKWAFDAHKWVIATPVVSNDGTIYIGSADGTFWAVNPDGTKKWSFGSAGGTGTGTVLPVPMPAGTGTVVAPVPTSWITAAAAIGADGTIYVPCYDGKLYAIDAGHPGPATTAATGGTLKWTFAAGDKLDAAPVVTTDGSILVGSDDGKLYAVSADGKEEWAYDTGGLVRSSAAMGRDGTVYIGSREGTLTALGGGTPGTWPPGTAALQAPVLTGPDDGAVGVGPATPLTWGAVPTATSYIVQFSTDQGFTTLAAVQETAGTGTVLPVPADGSAYYWRVQAVGPTGTSAFSSARRLTTRTAPPGIVTLLTPADGQAGMPVLPTLTWSPVNDAVGYEVQVATDAAFAAPVSDQKVGAIGTGTVVVPVPMLTAGTVYDWRVCALGAGGAGDWSAIRSFTTVVGPPGTAALQAPADGSTGVPRAPVLTWGAVPSAALYTVQIAVDAAFLTPLTAQDVTATALTAPALSYNTKFVWRVRASNAGGTGDWSPTWSFTTMAAPPPPPTLLTPPDGTAVAGAPAFTWSPVPNATAYTVQIASDPAFPAAGTLTQAVTSPTFQPPGTAALQLGRYYWRVLATTAVGNGDWSPVFSFTEKAPPPPAPTLLTPADGSKGVLTSPSFTWQPVDSATSYTLVVATDTAFAAIALSKDVSAPAAAFQASGLMGGTAYFWRLRADNGTPGPWSPTWAFTTKQGPPGAVTRPTPADGAAAVPAGSPLSWAATPTATSYAVQVATDQAFTMPIFMQLSPATAAQPPALTVGSTYYWRVRASNDGGDGPWSGPWSFTVAPAGPVAPPAPTMPTPTDGAVAVAVPISLAWVAPAGVDSYTVQVSADPTFATLTFTQVTPTPTATVPALAGGTKYSWRVKATAKGLDSPWSPVWSFTTFAPPTPVAPPAPTTPMPADGAADVAVPTTLTWVSPAGMDSYTVQVGADPTFAIVAFTQTTLTPTTTLPALNAGARYYWRVKATQAKVDSAWSAAWSFTTAAAVAPVAPPSPTLLTPANGATNMATDTALSWAPMPGADSYTVQVSVDQAFGALTFRQTVTTVSAKPTFLQNATQYYWRVKATRNNLDSPWSSVWSYTTVPAGGVPTPPIPTPPTPPANGALTLITPANGATDVPTKPLFTWTAVDNASYEIQVSTDAKFPVNGRVSLDNSYRNFVLAPGTLYYWRVCTVNDAGIGPWTATASFTTAGGAAPPPAVTIPPAPTLVAPADGATNVAAPVTLTWNAVPGGAAYTYKVQVGSDAAFTFLVPVPEVPAGATTAQVALPPGGQFYWHVQAVAPGPPPVSGQWSVAQSFTVAGGAVPPPVGPATPATPGTPFPGDGAMNVVVAPTLSWAGAPGVDSYTVQVSTDATFAAAPIIMTVTAPNAKPTGLVASTKYYWRVKATKGTTDSPWSATWSFTTAAGAGGGGNPPAGAITLLTPAEGAVDVPHDVAFSWQAVTGATQYDVEIFKNKELTSRWTGEQTQGTETKHTITLPDDTTWYWHVRPITTANGNPVPGDWSGVGSFTTGGDPRRPGAPTLLSPKDGEALTTTNVQLSWQPIAGATSYNFEVYSDKALTQGVNGGATGTQTTWSGVLTAGQMYWRVRAIAMINNQEFDGKWSATSSFTVPGGTAPPAPTLTAPTLVTPADGTRDVETNVKLTWTAVTGATMYTLEVDTTTKFQAPIFSTKVSGSRTYTYVNLPVATQCYWHVSALQDGPPQVKSDWSTPWSFTTAVTAAVQAPLAAPVLVSPSDGATAVDPTVTLQWNPVPYAMSYLVSVGADAKLQKTLMGDHVTDGDQNEMTLVLPPLTKCYWGVTASTTGPQPVKSPLSPVWSLTTAATAAFSTPKQQAPTNSATDVPINTALSWAAVPGAGGYTLQLSKTGKFDTAQDIYDSKELGSNQLSFAFTFDPKTTIYWRVQATGPAGTSNWSLVWSFTTGTQAVLSTPVNTAPADATTLPGTHVTLTWQGPVGATTYQYQVSTTKDMVGVIRQGMTAGGVTSCDIGLPPGGTYYWNVMAVRAGNPPLTSAWSTATAVTTGNVPSLDPPTLTSPTDGKTGVPVQATLNWKWANGATACRLQVATDADFTTLVTENTIRGTDTSFALTLTHQTKYYWRMRSMDDGPPDRMSDWSPVVSFSTEGLTFPRVVFTSQAAGGPPQAVVIKLDGTGRTVLTPPGESFFNTSFNSDGSRIIFSSNHNVKNHQIFSANADGTKEMQLTKETMDCTSPRLLPNRTFVFVGKDAAGKQSLYLYMMGATQITKGTLNDDCPAVSHDGGMLAFVRVTNDTTSDIWLFDMNTMKESQLTGGYKHTWAPSFSPDGNTLIFSANPSGVSQIYAINLLTKKPVKISKDKTVSDSDPVYTPDGKQIVFVRGDAPNRTIWVMDADGSNAKQLTKGPADEFDPDCTVAAQQ